MSSLSDNLNSAFRQHRVVFWYDEKEWNSRETSWGFKQNELIHFNGHDIEEAVSGFK